MQSLIVHFNLSISAWSYLPRLIIGNPMRGSHIFGQVAEVCSEGKKETQEWLKRGVDFRQNLTRRWRLRHRGNRTRFNRSRLGTMSTPTRQAHGSGRRWVLESTSTTTRDPFLPCMGARPQACASGGGAGWPGESGSWPTPGALQIQPAARRAGFAGPARGTVGEARHGV